MTLITKPQAILFDWDNTLVETWPKLYKTINGYDLTLVGSRSKEGELVIILTNTDMKSSMVLEIYKTRWMIGVSSKGHISKSVKVRPRLKGSRPRSLGGAMARKQDGGALRQHL